MSDLFGQMDIFDFNAKPRFKIGDKPIRLIELFAGVGSQAMALRDLGANFEKYRVVEIDKYAVDSYNAIHGTDFKPTDITKIGGVDLGISETDKYVYIMFYSFPCVAGDTLVLTKDGYKKIKEIRKNDFVLTHDNSYQRVLAAKKTGEKETYSINAMAIDELRCTENHKFYVREMYRTYPTYEDGRRGSVRHFKEPKWIECKNLNKNHYLGVAINQNSVMPKWDGVVCEWEDRNRKEYKNSISGLLTNNSFWYVIGRYVGDGWHRKQYGITISGNMNKVIEMETHLKNCGFKYQIVKDRTVFKVHIASKELGSFCEQFGKGAKNKRIPGFMFDMPTEYLKSFLLGYITSDGCYTGGVFKITSISRELIYGTAQLVAKVYKTPYRIYHTKRKPTCVIEGRTVNQNDSYELVWKLEKCKQDKAFYEDGYIWCPIKEIKKTGEIESVYDIETDITHSFVANGIIIHNCTDLSLAGKQEGMEKGSGTRSGLLWEVERLLKECKELGELPQVLIMENVPQVHGLNNIGAFNDWNNFLISLGYTSWWKDLNAKEIGYPEPVAQNRERCFMVSLLGDYGYTFPKPLMLKKTMRDYLEDEVDEKYYLKGEKVEKLIQELIISGELDEIVKKKS